MAIWHPGIFWVDTDGCEVQGEDGPELMNWPSLMVNPTGVYPSLTTTGQLDAGCYWYDPNLPAPCWAPNFMQCLSCCCVPQKCGIPDEVVMTLSGFGGTLTSIDATSDYGYGPSAIVNCSQFYQKNGGGKDADYYCFVQPPHTVKPIWHTSAGCCDRYVDNYFWWPRDSFRGAESTGSDLCVLDRSICAFFPSLCSGTAQPTSYNGKTPPRWIPTCVSCCDWGWFFWGDPDTKSNKQSIVDAADCSGWGTSGDDWYLFYEEFKFTDTSGVFHDSLMFRLRDPIWKAIERDTHLWPPGYCGFTSRNLIPLDYAFWNEWHIDTQGWPRSPFYENCWGGFWTPSFWDSFPDPRNSGSYTNWCTNTAPNFQPNSTTPVSWAYYRPNVVLISQPSRANCHFCWSTYTNLLNGSTDGHCNGTCNVNMQDLNRAVTLRSALYLQPPQFQISLNRSRVKPPNELKLLDAELLYNADAPVIPWAFEIDYPCQPLVFGRCNLNPGLVQPRLKAFYRGVAGYGAKIDFAIRIYCGPTSLQPGYGPIFNGGWWYVDDVWIGEADAEHPNPKGLGYEVGDRFYFNYYEDPLRGGETYWPTETGIALQECRVKSVSDVGEILAVELVLHVPRLADGQVPQYPEEGGDDGEFSGEVLESNEVTTTLELKLRGQPDPPPDEEPPPAENFSFAPVDNPIEKVENEPVPPQLVAPDEAAVYWSDDTEIFLAPKLRIITENDYVQITGATVTMTGLKPGDFLHLGPFFLLANITGSWDDASGVFTFDGTGTKDQYEEALQSLRYSFNGADPTIDNTRTTASFTWKVTAKDFSNDGPGPIILNLGCGLFFRNYRPPLYARVLNHRLSVAVPGNGYVEGDVLRWDPIGMPPNGQVLTGNKWYPYFSTNASVRKFARATVVEVDSRGGIVDWHMCGAENQLWFGSHAYNPNDAGVGFWPPSFESEWYADVYDYACQGEINTGDYYDIAYANKCDYFYVGYIPIRYSWSGIGHVMEKSFQGNCEHAYAEMFFSVEQISVKTDIAVANPIQKWGTPAKLTLIDAETEMVYPPPGFSTSSTADSCPITPVFYHNFEEAPGASAHVDAYNDESCIRFYKRHPIPVKQGMVTLPEHIRIDDPGSGYVRDDGTFPELSTLNGTIKLVNVCDDMRAFLAGKYGFPGYCHFRVSDFTADGGIRELEILWPGYWYFAHHHDYVWLHTAGSNWYFEMAWPTRSDDPYTEDPSPDCRVELSYQNPCCHATRDNWGVLHHFDGFPEPYPSSMYRYVTERTVTDPEAPPWENNAETYQVEYSWYQCGFGTGGAFARTSQSITGNPGFELAGDSRKRWSTNYCPDIGGTWKMLLVHPCAACARDQGLPGGQTCFNPCGAGNTTYSTNWDSPTMTGVGFWGLGSGGAYDWYGTGQAWISQLAGELNCTVVRVEEQVPPMGVPGDI